MRIGQKGNNSDPYQLETNIVLGVSNHQFESLIHQVKRWVSCGFSVCLDKLVLMSKYFKNLLSSVTSHTSRPHLTVVYKTAVGAWSEGKSFKKTPS